MKLNKFSSALISCVLSAGIMHTAAHASDERASLNLATPDSQIQSMTSLYIVELATPPAVSMSKATLSTRSKAIADNQYDAKSTISQRYRKQLSTERKAVISNAGISQVSHEYEHSFNGFSARLSDAQVNRLKADPRVKNVYKDELYKLETANTPAFLELDAEPLGLHANNVLGENIVIGIIDSGIWPENPSFGDIGYSDASTLDDWNGECETGTDDSFFCNNKMVGARYYDETFGSVFTILPDEFDSPRDADGHGSHVAGTAAGNAGVTAVIDNVEVGNISGIAPRARIATYKVCWNGRVAEESGCFGSDIMAAVDDAVADGVDVINMSISGSETNLLTPQLVAFFNATNAGVFSTISAGNRGPGAGTVGNPAPWITSTGASTYDGELVRPATRVAVDGGDTFEATSASAALTPTQEGFTQTVIVSDPLLACEPVTNDLSGSIALISRGGCGFNDKFTNALNAGAEGIIVYTDDRPVVRMASDPISVPAVMIANEDGLALAAQVAEADTSVTIFNTGVSSTQVGNIMADFSSRGENRAAPDIIKPDITAPGVNILAADTGFDIDTGVFGKTNQIISGTSMSSPHIAGIAALIKEVHPDWTPDMIKSAIMTTARQNMLKEDGVTATDAFDFGAGHVVPNTAINPGLVYKTSDLDYLAFLCGNGQAAFVEDNSFVGACESLENDGFSLDPSDLNLASIGIAELIGSQTVTRTVTNVTGADSLFTATVEEPAGVSVEVLTLNPDTNDFEAGNSLLIPAGGSASYQLSFTSQDDANFEQWAFGSITWSDGQYMVRSPIAVRPIVPAALVAPALLSQEVSRIATRFSIPVEINYNGLLFANPIGLQTASQASDVVLQDPDATFQFNTPDLGFFFFRIPEGTKAAKLAIKSEDYPEGVDLDMYVYRCPGFSCTLAASPTTAIEGSDEEFIFEANPLSLNGPTDAYVVFLHGINLNGLEQVDGILHSWLVDADGGNVFVRERNVAREGSTRNISVTARGLESGGDYLGGIVFTNEAGEEVGITLLDVERE